MWPMIVMQAIKQIEQDRADIDKYSQAKQVHQPLGYQAPQAQPQQQGGDNMLGQVLGMLGKGKGAGAGGSAGGAGGIMSMFGGAGG